MVDAGGKHDKVASISLTFRVRSPIGVVSFLPIFHLEIPNILIVTSFFRLKLSICV